MRIFVTGGTGFIGSHFIKGALSGGHEVVALRRLGSSPRIDLDENPRWIDGDLHSYNKESLEGCDVLVHLASYGVHPAEAQNWEQCFNWNVDASFQLWMEAIRRGVKKLVIFGSCFEYGSSGEDVEFITPNTVLKPQSAYAASKAAASMLARGLSSSYEVEVIIVRPFHVYGEGEADFRLWPSLRQAALTGSDFKMTKGAQVRDFISVEDVVEQTLDLLRREVSHGRSTIVHLASGHPQSILEFSQKWWSLWEAQGELKIGALPYRDNEVMRFVPIEE